MYKITEKSQTCTSDTQEWHNRSEDGEHYVMSMWKTKKDVNRMQDGRWMQLSRIVSNASYGISSKVKIPE
jgi:hypothetical protein